MKLLDQELNRNAALVTFVVIGVAIASWGMGKMGVNDALVVLFCISCGLLIYRFIHQKQRQIVFQKIPRTQFELHKQLLGHLRDGVILGDMEGKILFVNKALEELSGYKADQLVGQHVLMLSPPEDKVALEEHNARVLGGESVQFKARLKKNDGSPLWINSTSHTLKNDVTGEDYLLAIVWDIQVEVEAQEALEKEKKRFEFFVESLPHLMWSYGLDGKNSYLNSKVCELFGLDHEHALKLVRGTAWMDYVYPDDQERLSQEFTRAYSNVTPFSIQVRLKKESTNSYRWYKLQGSPHYNDEGQVIEFYSTGTDIDELLKTQEQLRDREHFYRSLIESQTTYLARLGMDGKYIYGNPALINDFYPGEAITEKIWMDTLHPDDQQMVGQVAEFLLEHPGTSREVIIRKKLPSGGYAHTEWEMVALEDRHNPEGGFFFQGIGRDVSSSIQTERERDILSYIVENTDFGVSLLDTDGKIFWVNEALVRQTGYQREELVGESPLELFFGPMTSDSVLNRIRESIANHESLGIEAIKYTSQRAPYWAEVVMQPSFSSTGQWDGYFVFERNVTTERRHRTEIDKLNQELVSKNQHLSEFTYQVSHNLRGALANIKGLAMLVVEDLKGQLEPIVLTHLRDSIQRLETVIYDMQSALEAGGEETSFVRYELLDMFQLAKDQLQSELEGVDVDWMVDFRKGEELWGSKSLILNVLYNLLSNSIKYRKRDGKLNISLISEARETEMLLVVKDNGRGMDLEEIGDRLFDLRSRFHQDVEGTGMGLYLVKRQLDHLNGKIEVESRPNEGTAFTITLPQPG